jgi:hypothetical protein
MHSLQQRNAVQFSLWQTWAFIKQGSHSKFTNMGKIKNKFIKLIKQRRRR